jgi:hypothetical protein
MHVKGVEEQYKEVKVMFLIAFLRNTLLHIPPLARV